MDNLGFSLIEGEELVEAIKPLPALKTYFFLTSFLGWFVILLIFGFWLIFPLIFLAGINGLFFGLLLILILPLVLSYITSSWQYEKTNYWITNKRIAVKRGLIGYHINSIPFERISDVIISRSFLESLFGFGSLQVQSLSGQSSYYAQGARFGAEGMLLAVPNPEELQHKIFSLIKQNREKQHLTM